MSAAATAPGTSQIHSPERYSEQPLFYAAIAFAAGIALGTYFFRPQAWWCIAAVVFLVSASILFRRVLLARTLACFGIAALGAFQAQLQLADVAASQDLREFLSGQEVTVTAHVIRATLPRTVKTISRNHEAMSHDQQVLEVETEEIETISGKRAATFGIRLNLHTKDESEEDSEAVDSEPRLNIAYGERLRFPAKLREPRNYGNPGAMDYRGYLLDRGIVALASVRADRIEKLPGFSGNTFDAWRYRVRGNLTAHMLSLADDQRVPKYLRLSQEQVGLLAAMLIGEQSLLERDTKLEFQRTGAFHILVVSGMNAGILAGVIFWISRKLRLGKVAATLATIVLSLGYAWVTDLGAPILRATIMLAIYLGARLLYRDKHSLNAVGIAALCVLAYSPKALFEPSFQLTFLSVVALGGICQPILERTSLPYRRALAHLDWLGYDAVLEPRLAQFRLDLRLILERIALFAPAKWAREASEWLLTTVLRAALSVYDVFVITALLQLALALPMSIYFHRLALLGVPTNLAVIPLSAVLMPAGIIATLLSYISQSLAAIPSAISALTLKWITGAVTYLGGIRFADVRVSTPSYTIAGICMAALCFAVYSAKKNRWLASAAITALVLSAAFLTRAPQRQIRAGMMEVSVIDVGQGDSILVVTPEGKTLLIDGGGPAGPQRTESFDVGEDVVSNYLWSRGFTRLDAVVLTHAHSDHLAGLRSVITNFRPKELWLGTNPDSDQLQALLKIAEQERLNVIQRSSDQPPFAFGGATFSTVSPPANFHPDAKTRNENSLVLRAQFGDTSALLTGDAERLTEHRIAEAAQHSDLLKVAHHGSGTSTSEEMLGAVKPQFAVISAGFRNLYGHPKQQVLERLAKENVRTFRTDTSGIATFYLDGKTVTPEVRR